MAGASRPGAPLWGVLLSLIPSLHFFLVTPCHGGSFTGGSLDNSHKSGGKLFYLHPMMTPIFFAQELPEARLSRTFCFGYA
jgi:hypothetical protein